MKKIILILLISFFAKAQTYNAVGYTTHKGIKNTGAVENNTDTQLTTRNATTGLYGWITKANLIGEVLASMPPITLQNVIDNGNEVTGQMFIYLDPDVYTQLNGSTVGIFDDLNNNFTGINPTSLINKKNSSFATYLNFTTATQENTFTFLNESGDVATRQWVTSQLSGVGSTNITYTPSLRQINSSTGTGAVLPIANGTNYGLSQEDFTTTEKTKLAGLSATETDPVVKAINGIVKSNGTTISAAVADTDYTTPSALATNATNDRNRSNHTGTQTASTISDFSTAVNSSLPQGLTTTSSPTFATVNGSKFNVGTLSYSDTGILASLQSSTNGYNQLVIQNTSNGASASSNLIVANDQTTSSTHYGEIGKNSSGFTGTGAFSQPNNVYLTSTSADLAIGTTTANPVHFVVNSGATDAMTINTDSSISKPVISEPSAPASGIAKEYFKNNAVDVFAYKTSSGQEFIMQDAICMGRKRFYCWQPNNTAINAFGFANTLATTGNATSSNLAMTNEYTKKAGGELLVTTASTTAVAGFRDSVNAYWIGNTAGDGGFTFSCSFGPATGVATTTHRLFVGMQGSLTAISDQEPSSVINIIGVGYDSADANLQIMRNDGTGTATKIDLGANFVVPTADRTNYYKLDLYVAPNSSTCFYKVTNFVNGAIATGSFNTDMPTVNNFMGGRGWISVGGTSSVIGIKISNMYLDSSK